MKEFIERGALESKAVYMHGFGKNKYVPLKAIQQAPAADVVEVKHGRWEWYDHTISYSYIIRGYMCSECGCKQEDGTNFCPNCGARMDGE